MDFTVKKPKGKYLGFGTAAISAFFLFNPDIALIDVLPDVIGYLLLTLSMRYMRDLSPHFENAWKKFRWLVLLSAAKLGALLWVFGDLSSMQERSTMMLLLSFSICVLELILGIPAWISLTEGFIIHAQTASGKYPLLEKGAKPWRPGKNVSISFREFTVFFMIAKAFFSNIAEFSVLSSHSYDDTAFDWYDFIGLFRIFALFFGVLIGICWLVKAIKYFVGILRDAELIESAKKKYETTVLPNKGLFIRRDIAFTLMLFCVAALLTADFYIDEANVIPDVLSALLLLWTFFKLRVYSKKWLTGAIITGVYGVVSIIGSAASYKYITESWVSKTWEDPKVFSEFMAMYPIRVVEAILLFICFALAFRCIRDLISENCGYIPTTMSEEYRTARLAAIHKEIGVKVTVCLVFAAIAAIIGGLYELIISFDLFISGMWWIFGFLASLAFAGTAFYMMNAITEEAESRYMLD